MITFIAGAAGTGKTHFSVRLFKSSGFLDNRIIHTDDYSYLDWKDQSRFLAGMIWGLIGDVESQIVDNNYLLVVEGLSAARVLRKLVEFSKDTLPHIQLFMMTHPWAEDRFKQSEQSAQKTICLSIESKHVTFNMVKNAPTTIVPTV